MFLVPARLPGENSYTVKYIKRSVKWTFVFRTEIEVILTSNSYATVDDVGIKFVNLDWSVVCLDFEPGGVGHFTPQFST